ncbi:MAG TPA: HD domain-containing phosphohydrolase [Gammaproteobacteria bacterium]
MTSTSLERVSAGTASVILVVDDHELNLDLLTRRLEREGHRVVQARDGRAALDCLHAQSIDLVLLDIMMPVLDGYQTLAAIKSDAGLRDLPVIMITAVNEVESAAACIEQGAEDYLCKPFNPILLRARVAACLERKRLRDGERLRQQQIEQQNLLLGGRVDQQVRELSSAQLAAIFAMSKLAESRDPETGEHLDRMREYCVILARQLAELPRYRDLITQAFKDNLYAASPLHDIGKVGIPDEILRKRGRLTPDEWKIMRTHPLIGGDTLREVDRQYPGNAFIRTGIDIAECHHERWDGGGYPRGLSGEQIPLVARILALADVYDALTSRRCYKEAFPHDQSRDIIVAQSGKHFDAEVVQAFLIREQEFIQVRRFFRGPDED